MSLLAERFKSALDAKGVRYEYTPKTEERAERVRITYNCDNIPSVSVIFFFDEGRNSVNIKCFTIAKVPETALMNMYVKLNELNADYRWIKFYIDSDNEVTASGDAIIDEETAGEECHELCMRYVNIIDECYPEIMKALWA